MDKMFDGVKMDSSSLGVANMVTSILTWIALIGSTALSALLVLSSRFTGSIRLYDALALLLVVNLLSAMFYVWIGSVEALGRTPTGARYFNWFLTVPLLFMAIIYYMDYLNTDKSASPINGWKAAIVVVLAFLMVLFSYIGSLNGGCDRAVWYVLALIAFILTMVLLGLFFGAAGSWWFFWVVVVVFALYGIVHFLDLQYHNVCYNILDGFSRVAFTLLISFEILARV